MARTLRMFSSEFPYEGGMGDVTQQDVPDAQFIDKEEAYGQGYLASPPLERSQIDAIGSDVATAMFGAAGTSSRLPSGGTEAAAKAAHREFSSIQRPLGRPAYKLGWDPYGTSWAIDAGSLQSPNRFDRRMERIAQKHNVSLFRVNKKSGGAPTWVFTKAPRSIKMVGSTSGINVHGIHRAV